MPLPNGTLAIPSNGPTPSKDLLDKVLTELKLLDHELRWPTVRWLFSDLFNLNDSTVTDVIVALEAEGLIKIEKGWIST